ncbi:GMC family oxidoreductase [Bradyrhizobium sp. Arg237L]|uniref:GMC family oxidoreductase n=1 Tax=Bradyrhizobium sp. Arg237L TaxID=3003352 RepID=UPI00249DC086|nr:GMC family oxidoreductase [Bradyrhizobium sp. Arg237L]MDI4239075.1 GMC family oxidoreductase [Bradyrhizobium sp. Arg237L]
MAERLKPVDVVTVGVGLTGAIMAKELAAAGLKVVGLERGPRRDTSPDFQSPTIHDELRFAVRKALMQDNVKETVSFRNSADQTALPLRRWQGFLPGTGTGGAAVHWNGQTYRFQPVDFIYKTHIEQRYGKTFVDPEVTIQDWGVTYDELERHYDRFEYLCGTSGKAGNLNGKIQPGGNPFEGQRSREYPTPPMKETQYGALFGKGAEKLGYKPYPQPASTLSQPYTNPEGLTLQQCVFCGFCERFACEHYAKASPQTIILPAALKNPNYELRSNCQVLRVNLDSTGRKATGVTYADGAGREFEQPAELVLITAFALNNVRLMLLSGIGKPYDPRTGTGTVGRNYAYQTVSSVTVFYDENTRINPFMASGSSGTVIDEFSGDNFDHAKLGFIGGAYVGAIMTNGRPIEFHPTPPGTPPWGLEWKKAVARHYNHTVVLTVHGMSHPTRTNYCDLDPTYKDAWGMPLLRLTFDFPDNDIRMSKYVTDKTVEIGQAMGGTTVVGAPRKGPYTSTIYQTTHNTGGAVMGNDPSTSAVNRYLQSWDVPNVFVIGASAFQHNGTYNPTDTVGALTYWAVDAIKNQYLKAPGPLVRI